ncbi:MAG: ABC transporter substrate-binding protein [Pseudobdellovibrionaceae bacterium]
MSSILRVAFPKNFSAKFYEPTRIHLAPEYIFLENTFSPLIELSPEDASIRAGVAESWEWKKNELHLHLRSSLKTYSGKPITAEDAAFSLKRLLLRTQNTHGNLKDLVCGAVEIKKIDDPCEGIQIQGNTLILKLSSPSPFILPMLSGIDFAIIPKASVDSRTLDIVNYAETSGPYFVSRDSDKGHIQLSANKNHYHYSEKIPQVIELIPVDPKNKFGSIEMFKRNEVDLITTIDAASSEEVYKLHQEISSANFHSTIKIRTYALFFTERGLKELTTQQRLSMGKILKESINPYFLNLPGYESTSQFFPQHGDGSISADLADEILKEAPIDSSIFSFPLSLSVVRVGHLEEYQKQVQTVLPKAAVKEGLNLPGFQKFQHLQEIPHAYIAGPDTGFNEDISLISYSLTAGFFGLDPSSRQKWLANYMSQDNKTDRIVMLQKIHESSLRGGLLVPLFAGSYTALAKNNWSIHLSKILANNPLWLIKKN